MLPASFPRHLIAYSSLFCELIDAQQRLSYAHHCQLALRESVDLRCQFPCPQVLMGWDRFRDVLGNQSELIGGIINIRKSVLRGHQDLSDGRAVLTDARSIFSEHFKAIIAVRRDYLAALTEFIRTSREIEQLRRLQRCEFDALGFDSGVADDDTDTLTVARHRLTSTIQKLRDYLAGYPHLAPARFDPFQHKTDLAVQSGGLAEQTATALDSSIAANTRVAQCFTDQRTIGYQTVVCPSLMNLDATINNLTERIRAKQEATSNILREISERRAVCDQATERADFLEAKVRNNARRMEDSRT
jgi:hypothetical protein